MKKKNNLIRILAISVIFLFIDVSVSSAAFIDTESTLINKENEKNCIDKIIDKTSIGKSELKILRSYQMWRGEEDVRIFFEIKNIGSEIFDGNIDSSIEMSPFSNSSKIIAHATGFGHRIINPGEKDNAPSYLGFDIRDMNSGIFYVRCYINPTGDDDTIYGNKMTEIVLILFPPYIYFSFFRHYK